MINADELSKIEELRRILARPGKVVFLGGAGTSTESGIPDFRSGDGVFAAIRDYGYPPETLLSRSFFLKHTETFYEYYRKFLLHPDAQPNDCHRALAKLEHEGILSAVITQNIDGLHQAAGSKRVIELHGSIHRCRCARCGKPCPEEAVNTGVGVPRCSCGGVLRPEVVLYEEPLAERDITDAVNFIRKADVLIVGGTSLAVYPAAGLLRYYEGRKLALVHLGATSYDESADLLIREKIGKVFSEV